MALTPRTDNTIMLSGPDTYMRQGSSDGGTIILHRAGAAFTPGHLIELYSVSNELKWRKNDSVTEIAAISIALDKPDEVDNTGIEDAYAANENVEAAYLRAGAVFNGIVASGQNITDGELLMSDGTGMLRTAAATTQDAMDGRFQALKNLGSIAADTRCPVLFIG